jgi:cobalamin 5'-phosphate synthase/cobalamin synthase
MNRLFAAVAFLTRLPVPSRPAFDGADVGRATLLFPLVGALLGGVLALLAAALGPRLPPLVAALLVIALSALLTGALHLDGLADMADGFGGGHGRDDVLRIMRDHAIGAYGAVALVLVIGVKAAALAALIARGDALGPLVVGPALGRWASVPLARFLPHAREEGGIGSALTLHVGSVELGGATLLAGALALALGGVRGLVFWAGVAAATLVNGIVCRRRIGGITGDTMGANTEVCEALVWTLAAGMP